MNEQVFPECCYKWSHVQMNLFGASIWPDTHTEGCRIMDLMSGEVLHHVKITLCAILYSHAEAFLCIDTPWNPWLRGNVDRLRYIRAKVVTKMGSIWIEYDQITWALHNLQTTHNTSYRKAQAYWNFLDLPTNHLKLTSCYLIRPTHNFERNLALLKPLDRKHHIFMTKNIGTWCMGQKYMALLKVELKQFCCPWRNCNPSEMEKGWPCHDFTGTLDTRQTKAEPID